MGAQLSWGSRHETTVVVPSPAGGGMGRIRDIKLGADKNKALFGSTDKRLLVAWCARPRTYAPMTTTLP